METHSRPLKNHLFHASSQRCFSKHRVRVSWEGLRNTDSQSPLPANWGISGLTQEFFEQAARMTSTPRTLRRHIGNSGRSARQTTPHDPVWGIGKSGPAREYASGLCDSGEAPMCPRGPWKTQCRKHTGFQNVTQHMRPPFPFVLFNFMLLFPPSPVQPEFKIPTEASDAYPLSLQGKYHVLKIWA